MRVLMMVGEAGLPAEGLARAWANGRLRSAQGTRQDRNFDPGWVAATLGVVSSKPRTQISL